MSSKQTNNWRSYVKQVQLAYIANGYPISYQQAMIIARESYEKGTELEKQKEPEVKKELVPELKTVNKEEEPKKITKKLKQVKKSKKSKISESESESEDDEYLEYLKLKRKYNKKK